MFRKVDTANKRPVHVLFPQKCNHKFSTCLELWCRLLSWNCGCYIFRCGELQSIHHLPKPINLFSINRKLVTLLPMEELDQLTRRCLHLFRLCSNTKNCFIWIGDVIFFASDHTTRFKASCKKALQSKKAQTNAKTWHCKIVALSAYQVQMKGHKKIQSSASLEYFRWSHGLQQLTTSRWLQSTESVFALFIRKNKMI